MWKLVCSLLLLQSASSADALSSINNEPIFVSSRIVGGQNVSATPYPWYATSTGDPSLCGGTLIASNLLLSAAHCKGAFANGVLFGATLFKETQFRAQVVKETIHPGYDADTLNNDFMILELDQNMDNLLPVKLNLEYQYPEDRQNLRVLGFGLTREGGGQSNHLQQVTLRSVGHTTCQSLYRNHQINETSMLCAYKSKKGSCQGDSGGPIVDEANVQVGVVSFGVGCAHAVYPGIFARISGATDFLQSFCGIAAGSPEWCPNGSTTRVPTSTVAATSTTTRTITSTQPLRPTPSPIRARPTRSPVRVPTTSTTTAKTTTSTSAATSDAAVSVTTSAPSDLHLHYGGRGTGGVTLALQITHPVRSPRSVRWWLKNSQGSTVVSGPSGYSPGSGETWQVRFDQVPAGTYRWYVYTWNCRGLGETEGDIPSAVASIIQPNGTLTNIASLPNDIRCGRSITVEVPDAPQNIIVQNGMECTKKDTHWTCVSQEQAYDDLQVTSMINSTEPVKNMTNMLMTQCPPDQPFPVRGACQCGVYVMSEEDSSAAAICRSCTILNNDTEAVEVSFDCSNVVEGPCVGLDENQSCICADSTTETFEVEGEQRTCEWLSSETEFLCGFSDVAQICPSTCGQCGTRSNDGCQDSASLIELPGAPGDVGCDFLNRFYKRFGYACQHTGVSIACPLTCQLCNADNED